jgi:HSP20 family molecular chaperone IbpA
MSFFRNEPFLTEFFAPNLGGHVAHHHEPAAHQHNHYSVETVDSVTLRVDVPGIAMKDLQIRIDDNVLRIIGERKTAGSESKVYRSFSIDPTVVDVDNIKAFLDCGVLTLIAPKKTQPAVSKIIAVTEAPLPEIQPEVAQESSE